MEHQATLVLRNARIYTQDAEQPWAEALALAGDRVLWAGPDAEAAQWYGPRTHEIDGAGRLALPGLIDSHFHLLSGARTLGRLQLDAATRITDVQSRLLAYAASMPGDGWLVGRGWMYRIFPPGTPIDRRLLDAVIPDRPVLLTAFDGHTAWANTVALQLAGILEGADTGTPFSTVVMGEDGLALGELREGAAINLVRRLIPPISAEEEEDLLRRALRDLAALGLTAVQNMDGDLPQLELYRRFAARGALSLRMLVPLLLSPQSRLEQIDEWAAIAATECGPWLRTAAVKLLLDGVVESKTALLLAPYNDGSQDLGEANYAQAQFEQLVGYADAQKLQVFVHAIGDAAVRRTLDAFAAAQTANGRRDSRHRIEHVELIDPSDVARFAALQAIASMQPIHANFGLDPANTWHRLSGPQRWRWGFPWRKLADAGVPLAFGSDWPVASPDPIRGLHVALNRPKLDGSGPESDFPDQRVTLPEAIAAYTSAAAYAAHREHEQGRLKPGYLADVTLLNDNLFALPPEAIGDTKVDITIVGGEVVWERT
ncbi:MAG: amidohydrolase [Oscillochloris sp.]|nr:amidohydrolase [Oscillochloris sp.]